MRIIGGKYKGRRINYPKHIRPTQDKVRQAIFDMLAGVMEGSRVLDLFAGSGAMGIESLSRGASRVCFIDADRRCARIIKENLEELGKGRILHEEAQVYANDAFRALKILASRRGDNFDIIFIDPPYHKGLAKKALKTIALGGILAPLGFAVVEHARTDALDGAQEAYFLFKKADYGDITVSVFQMRA